MALQKPDLPRGTLDTLVLWVVSLGPIHGYAITQRIRQISKVALQVMQGSLYLALHRLQNRGSLASGCESETGRDDTFYRLTSRGRARLREETASWNHLAEAIGLFLRAAEGDAP